MMRQIAFCLLLILLKPYNAAQQRQSNVFTFLRTDTILPGPSMRFNKSLASGVFEFGFKTFVDRALMLYQDDNGKSDHIQISFQDGRLWFLFYVSKNNRRGTEGRFTSEKKYNDFEWHTLRIERNASFTSIVLDNGEEKESFQTAGLSSFKSNLLIGGFSIDQDANDLSNPGARVIYVTPFSKRGFFNACVRNIKYGETLADMKEITNEYIEKYKVRKGCNLNYCHKPEPMCKNNGRCSPVGKNNLTCDCRWTGFTKPYCKERALELQLDGTYKVKHLLLMAFYREEKYAFRIKTLQRNAVLFYARGPSNYADFTLIEIKSSKLKMVVNFGGSGGIGINYTATSSVRISDGKWHFVEYEKQSSSFTLKVDTTSKTVRLRGDFRVMEYDVYSFLGEHLEMPYKHQVIIQDFIWETKDTNGNFVNVNFVTGLYKTYENLNQGFWVLPDGVRPTFNKRLPNSTPKPMSNTFPTPKSRCSEGRCSTKGSGPGQTTSKPEDPKNLARDKEDDDDEDSSVTWIVVVTVIFSLLLFAAIAFFVHKWNQRYSGDFQVNRKPIGPAGTIVHYQDAGHKEKQRQMKL